MSSTEKFIYVWSNRNPLLFFFFRFYVLITLQHMNKNLNRNKVFENTCIPLSKSRSILSICVSEIIQRAWWILGLSWRLGLCVLNIVHLISFLVANQYEWPCVEYIHVIPCIKYWNRVIKSILQHWVGINSLLCYSIKSLMQGIIFRTKYTHWTCKIDFTWIIIAFLVHRTYLFILKYCWL